MNSKKQITPVSVSGAYWTGASAVIDLLAEHPSCAIVPGEYTLFSFGQFFQEVYKPLLNGNFPDVAIKRHLGLMRDFDGSDIYPWRAIGRKLSRIFRVYPRLFFNPRTSAGKVFGAGYRKSRLELDDFLSSIESVSAELDFAEFSEKLGEVLTQTAMGVRCLSQSASSEMAIFDQMVSPPYYEDAMRAIPDMKFINVDRDWRDQYVSLRSVIKIMMERNRSLGIRPWDEDESLIAQNPSELFLQLRQKTDRFLADMKEKNLPNIIFLKFEDLIRCRDVEARKLFDFLGLRFDDWRPDSFFHPAQSLKKVEKWKCKPWVDGERRRELDFLSENLG